MWAHIWILPLLSVVLRNPGCLGYPTGSPLGACSSLTPHHSNYVPQQSHSPYSVQVNLRGGKVHVSLSHSPEFKGFLIQARSRNDHNRIVHGTFTDETYVSKTLDCYNGRKNTLTHTNQNPKRGINTVWTPAAGTDEDVIFRATVVEKYDKFWTEIDSLPVRVRSGIPTEEIEPDSGTMDYSSCSVSKGCFGFPFDCVSRRDCEVLVSYASSPTDHGVSFTMEGSLSNTDGYIATAISTDNRMGDDSVTECFIENGGISTQESWNRGKSNQPIRKLRNDEYQWKYFTGIATCSWIRPYETTVNRKTFNLLNETYHILIAKGAMRGGGVGYHTEGRIASAERVNFSAYHLIGEISCSEETCKNGGSCSQDGTNDTFRCSCKHGYSGLICDEKILCSEDICENGGFCRHDGEDGVFKCSCTHGYYGPTCDKKILCSEDICGNGGFCRHDGEDGVFRCSCTHGYYGPTCDKKIICLEDTCKNGGTCTQDGVDGVFRCSCTQGYEGLTCEKTTTITCECRKKCPSHSEKWKDYGGQFCYIVEEIEEVDWNQAFDKCSREGGSLANFHSAEELNRVSCHIIGGWYHIGLRKNANGAFEWTDKSALDFQNWDPDEPNNDNENEMCVFMYGNGKWNDISCKRVANYICSATKSV